VSTHPRLQRHSALYAFFISLLAFVTAHVRPVVADSALSAAIDHLGDLDYATRVKAGRTIRRTSGSEAVAALTAAVNGHSDQYVRFRALVLLTGFNDSRTSEVVRGVLTDRNDRLRAVAYAWLEQHPESTLTTTLLGALDTEAAEFVRPALVRALAALDADARVRAALIKEVGRGMDFFRGAVIAVLGDRRAVYAVDAVASVARQPGPLQDDAVLALGRIGDKRALAVLDQIEPKDLAVANAIRASRCLLVGGCDQDIAALAQGQAGGALAAIAAAGSDAAVAALVEKGLGSALSAVALRAPSQMLSWLSSVLPAQRERAIALLDDGFERLEEDFAEEQFFASARAAYWKAPEGSVTRAVVTELIQKLDF
jgi:hypothetical protein